MFLAQATWENRDVIEPGQPYFEDAQEGCLWGGRACFPKEPAFWLPQRRSHSGQTLHIALLQRKQKCKQWRHTRVGFLCFSYQEVSKENAGIYSGLLLLLSHVLLMTGKEKKNQSRNRVPRSLNMINFQQFPEPIFLSKR